MNPQYIISKFAAEVIFSIVAGLIAEKVIKKINNSETDFESLYKGFEIGRRYYEYENNSK